MTKLWQKSGTKLHPLVNQYMVSKDLFADNILLPYDVQASIAHAKMLGKVKLISATESQKLVKELEKISKLAPAGKFILKQEDEDCHTAIENYLTKQLGDTGKKIHTGRSRNDQVLTAIRLYSVDQLKVTQKAIKSLAKTILSFAKKYEFVPMPGYTHTQQAMPSSVGQWAGSSLESLLDDHASITHALYLTSQNPLGSAAGFGTSLPIDRQMTTKLLAFDRPQINSLYCQNSRGKIEAATIYALLQVMMSLGRIANDLIWFTAQEFQFFTVDPSLTTGSSIMPQKRNLDIMEVLRANVSVVAALHQQTMSVAHNLISGYHKDLKITKEALIKSFQITNDSLAVTELLFKNIKPNEARLKAAFTNEIYAADLANEYVQQGIPFRDAYQKVAANLPKLNPQDPVKNLKAKNHLGATGNLNLAAYQKALGKL